MSEDTLLADAINFSMPEFPMVALPTAILVALVTETQNLRKDLDGMRDELKVCRADFDALTEDLKRFKVFTKTGQVDDLWDVINDHENQISHLRGIKKPGSKMDARLRKLDELLVLRNNEAMTFSEIGKILELGSRDGKKSTRRQAMTKFGKALESKKECYEISNGETVKCSRLVKLRRDYYYHVRKEVMGV